MTPIGTKIKKLREDKDIKPEYFAEALGISAKTLQRIETNSKSPTLEELEQIAKELEVTAEELQFGEPKMIFENCNQKMFFNNGTINYQAHEEVKAIYEKLLQEQKEEILFLRQQLNGKNK
jgi:transcriptional regulator with XRE-family HTH domain